MSGVQRVEIHIACRPGRAAYPGNYNSIILVAAQFFESPYHGAKNDSVAASGTPDMRELFSSQIFFSAILHVVQP
jgi:hypothetical protein